MDLYVNDDEFDRLQTVSLDQSLARDAKNTCLTEICWHLRQRDSKRASSIADQLEWDFAQTELAQGRPDVSGTDNSYDIQTINQQRARIALVRAEIAALTRQFSTADQFVATARHIFLELNDCVGEGDSYLTEAIIVLEQGALKRAVELTESAVTCFDACDPMRSMLAQGWLLYLQAFYLRETVQDNVTLLKTKFAELKHPAFNALVIAAQGEILFAQDSPSAAAMFAQASEFARQCGLIRLAIMSICNAGVGLQRVGNFHEAAAYYEWAVNRARETGWPALIAFSSVRLGELLRHFDHLEQSQELLQQALNGLQGGPNGIHLAIAYAELANTMLRRGLAEEAAAHFQTAIQLYRDNGSRINLAEHLISQGRALSAAGQVEPALLAIGEAQALIAELSFKTLEVDVREALAEIHGRHHLPGPTGITASDATVHFLEDALRVGGEQEGWHAPSRLLSSLAEAWAVNGDGMRAFAYAKRATKADQAERSKQSENWTLLMQVRHEIERAKSEALHHQQLAESSRETARTLSLLAQIGQEITAELNFDLVCKNIQRYLESLLGTGDVCIWLRDEEHDLLKLTFCVKNKQILTLDKLNQQFQAINASNCLGKREEILCEVDAIEFDPRNAFDTQESPFASGQEATSFALFGPLIVRNHAFGVIAIRSTNKAIQSERERLIFQSLCAYGAIALDNAHAHHELQTTQKQLRKALLELEEASLTDPLTGLKNRRFLVQHIESDVARSVRYHLDFANLPRSSPHEKKLADLLIFLVDLDHFKMVNDRYGHAAGDAILVQIKKRLQKVFRDSDYLIRWGGEEFLIVARGTSREEAEDIAERVRLVVSEEDFALDGDNAIRQTCSVGFACFPFIKEHPRAITWQDVIDIADTALYAVKHSGRNGWMGLFANSHAWPELLLCNLKSDAKSAIMNGELMLKTNMPLELAIAALANKPDDK